MISNWLYKHFGGHFSIIIFGHRVTVYGHNAMHFAVNISSLRYGYICFRPTTQFYRHKWQWYFYLSPNGTPSAATYAIGPGIAKEDQRKAKARYAMYGHGYSMSGLDYGRDILFNTDDFRWQDYVVS